MHIDMKDMKGKNMKLLKLISELQS